MKLKPDKWIINDLNKDLINTWRAVRDEPKYIVSEFKKFGKKFKPMNIENKKRYCKKILSQIDQMKYDKDRVVVFMLMKFCCYMGVIMNNNKFHFFGLDLRIVHDNKYFFLQENNYNNIMQVSDFLNTSNGKIFNMDYKKVLSKAKEGDFVFLDPPYIEDHDYRFNYNKDEKLDNVFLRELLGEVKKLDRRGVKWMMTQAETKEIKSMFKEYNIKKFPVYRAMNKSYSNELLIMNY